MNDNEFILDRSEYCLRFNKTIESIFESDNEANFSVSEKANKALMFLLESIKKLPGFSYENKVDFLILENCFHNIIQTAYKIEKDTADTADVLSIELLRDYLEDRNFQYLSYIYDILKCQFNYWISTRDNWKKSKEKPTYERFRYCSLEHINEVRKLVKSALEIIPSGELANRLGLIADLRIIYNLPWTMEMKDELDEIILNLPSYNNRTKENHFYKINSNDTCYTFIKDTHCEEYFYPDPDLGRYEEFYGFETLPYYEDNTEKFNHSEYKIFLHIMSYPAHINSYYQVIKHYVYSIETSIELEQQNIVLNQNNTAITELNELLRKAQEDKKQVIKEFAHTYGNMRATTLHDIGTKLLNQKNAVLHKWGRKIMVEYAIKENLTKEVEMLKLQFEDELLELLMKLRDTTDSSDGLTVSELVSDALQRCFMALLYGETNSDKSRRKLFFGTEQYAQQREVFQESFDEDVLINGIDMMSWLKQNQTLEMSVDISGVWETLRFENGGYAALLLTNWLAELLTNAMKYADKSEPIKLTFSQQHSTLCIGISNNIESITRNTHGGQHGISSIEASIVRLNHAVGFIDNPMMLITTDTKYQLQLYVASAVFLG